MARRNFLLTSILFLLTAATEAQVSDNAEMARTNGTRLLIPVKLLKGLDAKKCKVNDRIEAETTVDLRRHGDTVIPRHTKIIGHVTEVKADRQSSPGSMVGIVFDYMVLKSGQNVPLQATVQAIAPPVHREIPGSGPDTLAGRPTSSTYPLPPVGLQGPSSGPASLPEPDRNGIPAPPSARDSNAPMPDRPPVDRITSAGGVVGIQGLSLNGDSQVAVLRVNKGNLRLEAGSQLLLRVQ
jgi:hypothetical protein